VHAWLRSHQPERKGKAMQLVVRLTTTAKAANSEVLGFGFRYCKLQPSKFT
jgi:hypothetical protein